MTEKTHKAKSVYDIAMKKINEPGRPAGAPNAKSQYVRDENCSIRVTEGFNKVVQALIDTGNYKSKADVIHEALQVLANRKLTNKKDLFWINKIM